MNLCKCGCGIELKIPRYPSEATQFIRGHNWRGNKRPTRLKIEKIICACGCKEIIDNYRRKKDGRPYKVIFQKGHMWKGSDNHFWKGGKTPEAKLIRQSTPYRIWRKAVFERDNYTCQICGARNQQGVGKTIELNADHIKAFALFPELRFDISNGRTLCRSCHLKTATFGGGSRKLVIDK